MRRREITLGLLAFAAGGSLASAVCAQPNKLRRIGYLAGGTEAARKPLVAALRLGLQQLGYHDGTDYVIEARFAGAQ